MVQLPEGMSKLYLLAYSL